MRQRERTVRQWRYTRRPGVLVSINSTSGSPRHVFSKCLEFYVQLRFGDTGRLKDGFW